jgi:hypothetical protein
LFHLCAACKLFGIKLLNLRANAGNTVFNGGKLLSRFDGFLLDDDSCGEQLLLRGNLFLRKVGLLFEMLDFVLSVRALALHRCQT